MNNYKLTIAYDGTNYCGWQVQPNGLSIQELIQEKIAIILRKEIHLTGSGRTDAGVHALGQVANFHFPSPIDPFRFHGSLNGLLPHDIRIKEVLEVPHDFHARYGAIAKTYHYHLHLDRVQDPFTRLYRYHVRDKISISLLKETAQLFLGTHDFTAFANEAHTGVAAHDPIRTLQRLDVIEQPGGIRLELEADGFLYKMVRNIVGTLVEVAAEKRSITEIATILESKDRKKAGTAAPPQGLFLAHVVYKNF